MKKSHSRDVVHWLITIIAATTVIWHGSVILQDAATSAFRWFAVAVGVITVAGEGLSARLELRHRWILTAFAVVTSFLFWLGIVELVLTYGSVMALGVFGILFLGLVTSVAIVYGSNEAEGRSRLASGTLNLAFATIVMVAFLFCLEGVLRAFFPLQRYDVVPSEAGGGACFVRNAAGRYVARPGFRGSYIHPEFEGLPVEINDFGLRDGLDEVSPPAPGEASVLVLGDSFVFGLGVSLNETFQEQLEVRSAEICGRPLRVYAAGIPGYGPPQELQMLKDFSSRCSPDVVVVAFFEENDFQDNWTAVQRQVETRRRQVRSTRMGKVTQLRRFLQGLTTYQFWAGSSATVSVFRMKINPLLFEAGIAPTSGANCFLQKFLLTRRDKLVARQVDSVMHQLEKIRKECTRLSAALLIMVVPAATQAEPSRFARFRSHWPETKRPGLSRTSFHRSFVRRLEQNRFAVADMLPALEAAASAGLHCYYREGHWNASGHALAAKTLSPMLADLFAAIRRDDEIRNTTLKVSRN